MATNPTAAEIGDPIFKESAFNSFPCVLLGNNDQQLGDWCDGDEVVKLQFRSFPDFSEPRIDIRLTIKWNEDGVPSAECPANPTFRIFSNQIDSIDSLLVVSHGPEKEPPTFADAMKITPAFAELLAMQFGIPESTKVMNLIAEKRLWVICIKMKQLEYDNVFGYCTSLEIEPDLPRFGIVLFNQTHTYGNQTDKARAGPHLDDIINEFRVSMDNTPPFPFAGFFGEHFDKPVVQYGDDTPKERRPEIRPGTNLAFRNDNYYIVFLGYAAIAEYKSEMVGCEQGNYFDAHIKVTPISKQEKNKFIGFLELPSHIARFKVDFVISLRFQEEATVNRAPRVADPHVEPKRDVSTTPKNMDVWLGRVVDHLPDAPNDTTSDVFLVSLGKKYDIVMNLHHILHLTSFQKKSSDCDH